MRLATTYFIFLTLNDEHQGVGGTLVFVDVYITMLYVFMQGNLC